MGITGYVSKNKNTVVQWKTENIITYPLALTININKPTSRAPRLKLIVAKYNPPSCRHTPPMC